MNFILGIYSTPSESNTLSAFNFAKTVLSQNHAISQIFFYQGGVLNACSLQPLFTELNIPLLACSTALLKRNIDPNQLTEGFQAASLTQFFDVLLKADRYVIFGN